MDYNKVYSKVHLREAASRNYNSVLFFLHLWLENPEWEDPFAKYREFCIAANNFHDKLRKLHNNVKNLKIPREKKGKIEGEANVVWAKWPLDPMCDIGCADINCMEWYFWAVLSGIFKVRKDLDTKQLPAYDINLYKYLERAQNKYGNAKIAKQCFDSNVSFIVKMLEANSSYATKGALNSENAHSNSYWLEDKYAKSIADYLTEKENGMLPKDHEGVKKLLKTMKSLGVLKSENGSRTSSESSYESVKVDPSEALLIPSDEELEKMVKEKEEKETKEKERKKLQEIMNSTLSLEEYKNAVCKYMINIYGPIEGVDKIFDKGYKAALIANYKLELFDSDKIPEDFGVISKTAKLQRKSLVMGIENKIKQQLEA